VSSAACSMPPLLNLHTSCSPSSWIDSHPTTKSSVQQQADVPQSAAWNLALLPPLRWTIGNGAGWLHRLQQLISRLSQH
jgi:hypothetical protein